MRQAAASNSFRTVSCNGVAIPSSRCCSPTARAICSAPMRGGACKNESGGGRVEVVVGVAIALGLLDAAEAEVKAGQRAAAEYLVLPQYDLRAPSRAGQRRRQSRSWADTNRGGCTFPPPARSESRTIQLTGERPQRNGPNGAIEPPCGAPRGPSMRVSAYAQTQKL